MQRLIFYSLTEAETFNPKLIEQGVADIQSRGFDAIYLEGRNLRADHEAPRVREAHRRLRSAAKKLGMPVVVNASYNVFSPQMIREAPECFSDSLFPVHVDLKQGTFTISGPEEVLHREIERAYLIEPAEGHRLKRSTDVTSKLKVENIYINGGGCGMTNWKARAIATATYRVAGVQAGRVLVLLRQRYEYAYHDLGQPKIRRYVDRMIEHFRTMNVDGFCWDEPHFGFAFFAGDGRAINDRMCDEFKKRFGYDLRPRLIDHWYDLPDGRSPLTRLHYAELMEKNLADLESYFERKASAGTKAKRVFLGIHRTMHEETSDDFFIGSVDYFRHNRFTSDGFTDSVFGREDSMISMMHLARSLAAEKGGDAQAYNNSWGFDTHEAQHDYYISLMSAMNVRWIGHTYRSSHLFGPGYPHHDCWATMKSHLSEHGEALNFLDGATPDADTAVLYNWRALAGEAGPYLHTHRRNLLLLTQQLTLAGEQMRFISIEQLEKAKSRERRVVTSTGSYRRLIVPWPDLLTPAAFAALERLSADVLIFGPPARMTSDGKDASKRFAALVGAKRFVEARVQIGSTIEISDRPYTLDPLAIEKGYPSNEKVSYADHFKTFNSAAGLMSKRGNVRYFGCELPHYPGLVDDQLPPESASPKDLLLFRFTRGTESLLSGVARWNKPVSAVIPWAGHTLRLNQCKFFVARSYGTQASLLADNLELE